jgi:alpha-galactosidase
MYDCDRGDHLHGNADTPAQESRDCYAFRMVLYMSKVIDKLCKAHPDAIVDFDVTEGMRSFGLAFLSSGKYFAINNGPYYQDYDIKVPDDVWNNIFVHSGPARTWVCRQNLAFDKWIPSVLLMTHYLPDDPTDSQMINLGSLILGQNGIWGDLPGVSEEGVTLFGNVLGVYKRVRNDITSADPIVVGRPGEMLEVHEKINGKNGRGAVVVFSHHAGTFRYRLQSKNVANHTTIFGNVTISEKNGRLWLEAAFEGNGASIIFFE